MSTLANQAPLRPTSRSLRRPAWLMVGFWGCVVIAIAVAVRRLVELTRPSAATGPTLLAQTNATFASHAALTAAHVIPAALFVLVAVAVLLKRRSPHWFEAVFFALGAITGVTAYLMDRYAIGGWIERSAVLTFNTWFLFSLGRAFWFYMHDQPARKREWMTRSVGILLGIATTRPVMGVFFATSTRTHLSPHQFFGIAFWIGFSINAAVVELWLHSRRHAQLQQLYWQTPSHVPSV